MKNFSRCHPATNFIFYISAVVFGVIFRHPVFLCISFTGALVYNLLLSGKKAIKGFFCFLLPMILTFVVINGLTAHYGVTVLIEMENGNNICLEPIIYGLVAGVSTSGVIMLFSCYNKTVTSDKLLCVLGKKLPKMAMLLNMSLRFVPLYALKLKEISAAQKGLGKGLSDGTFTDKIKSGGRMITVLISIALEGAIETADSMKSRGYALKNRSHYSDFRFTFADGIISAILIICDIIIIIASVLGETQVIYNPFFRIGEITSFSIFTYVVYFILYFTPVFLDAWEEIKWKILNSKI